MNILLCGANGFIGRHLADALTASGHTLIRGVRIAKKPAECAMDFAQDTDPAVWHPRLHGVDAVVNAVGVLRDTARTPMNAIHSATPRALFAAAEQAGVKKIIHISALGVGTGIENLYMRSKQEAENALQASPLNWTILRPSLVYGVEGTSARMFRLLAKLPFVGLPGKGDMLLQPLHIHDLAEAVCIALQSDLATQKIIECGGQTRLSYKAMIAEYAAQQGRRAPRFMPIPWPLMNLAGCILQYLPHSPLAPETLAMLRPGNVCDIANFTALLGHTPLGIEAFAQADKIIEPT